MGDKTGISWSDATWNPTTGCTRVSAGCDHCYAFQLHDQRYIAWKQGRMPDAAAQYHQPFSTVQLLPGRLDLPLHWSKPRRIFVDSMADLFHEDVPDEFLHQAFTVMRRAHWHTFQILTKRPERMYRYMKRLSWTTDPEGRRLGYLAYSGEPGSMPLPNVWLGVSVENQVTANERIAWLLKTPAAVRFLSCEPLLSAVSLGQWFTPVAGQDFGIDGNIWPGGRLDSGQRIHWLIVGGESGPHARPMRLEWAESIAAQCTAAGVPFHMKQLGSAFGKNHHDISTFPLALQRREYPRELVMA